ncbi:MAG: hypothetical protein IPI64_06305 [Chloracidobacterium sp.]|nr:hypothetical protein [Chloracidobacterium sp.]
MYLGLVLAGATPQVLAQGKSDADITINKRPLTDFADSIRKKIESKEIDLTAPFSVECEAYFTPKGGLDQKLSKFTVISGDPKMVELAKNAIEAIGDSGYFQYLQAFDHISKGQIKISQDSQNFTTSILSNAKSPERARIMSSALSTLIRFGVMQTKSEDGKLILRGLAASADQTAFEIKLVMSASEFRELILHKIALSVNDKP